VTCEQCALYVSCVSEAQKRNHRGKRVRIHRRQYLFQEVLEKEKNPEFKTKLRERVQSRVNRPVLEVQIPHKSTGFGRVNPA
jgi:hypothetical protein